MHRRTAKLSVNTIKAIDALLDHASTGPGSGLTRVAAPVEQKNLAATTKLLALLDELEVVEPPKDLLSKTMARIDGAQGRSFKHRIVTGSSDSLHNLH